MSFYTSLSGLNAATAQLGVTSNNIANVGTTGFKRSRADFGDIFASSPLQKSSSTVGQGVALKQVSQEFNQGNVTSSSNSLDLAISGDGFFPLRSADGLQDIYTRNGSFMLNEQFNVVNSAGQRLMAATVDSTGSANVNERVVLTIPQKTSGEAKQTSTVALGLNFPADAPVISAAFNRADSSTYNKSTAMTVYDKGGNGYLATIYYVKTQNANQSSPYNKWQTYVYVGDEQVQASLTQATNAAGEKLYVNQYGELQPYSAVKDYLTTAKTQLISLDELTDKRTSVPATVSSTETMDSSKYDLTHGVNFKTLGSTPAGLASLKNVFTLDVDNSANPIKVDLSYLSNIDKALTGNQIASELTNYLNRKFGDQAYFDLSGEANRSFTISTSRILDPSPSNTTGQALAVPIKMSQTDFDTVMGTTNVDLTKMNNKDVVKTMQYKLDNEPSLQLNGAANTIKVNYDNNSRTFTFVDGSSTVSLSQGTVGTAPTANALMGLDANTVSVNETGYFPNQVLPNGATIRPANEQRYGISVSYDAGTKTFAVKSGTTGDKSSISLSVDEDVNGASLGKALFGFKDTAITTQDVALRGIASSPAVAYGTTPTINVTNNFTVDDTNNKFVVTVDGIKGTVTIPTGTDYSVTKFAAALQKGINSMGDGSANDGLSPKTVNGVNVKYDYSANRFVFTTGTASSDSFMQVSGSATWGLEQVEAGRGSTSSWIKPTQHKDLEGTQLAAKYIDGTGQETTSVDGFTNLPACSPVYL